MITDEAPPETGRPRGAGLTWKYVSTEAVVLAVFAVVTLAVFDRVGEDGPWLLAIALAAIPVFAVVVLVHAATVLRRRRH